MSKKSGMVLKPPRSRQMRSKESVVWLKPHWRWNTWKRSRVGSAPPCLCWNHLKHVENDGREGPTPLHYGLIGFLARNIIKYNKFGAHLVPFPTLINIRLNHCCWQVWHWWWWCGWLWLVCNVMWWVTHTCAHGYGFPWVEVRVELELPMGYPCYALVFIRWWWITCQFQVIFFCVYKCTCSWQISQPP